ncbi:MAG: PEP-CTERM sorting domain-containing protein [Leptolyngbyaceae cyanobacterium SM1_1_3]|nr:PEP-CTERM sorting domain-containing protein [Leptolyngbyaceae cyanobacterium SM1_1_3]
MLAYEDIYNGGDQDYNDVVIAVKGLFDTADTADVPEPGSVLALLGLGLVGAVVKRKQLT